MAAYASPPRFAPPQMVEVPPVRMAAPSGGFAREFSDSERSPAFSLAPSRSVAPPVIQAPPFRMAAPQGGFGREFGGFAGSHAFSAPAEHGSFHGGGRGRR